MHLTIVSAVVLLAVACGIFVFLLSRSWTASARTGLEGFGALVTFLAVVLGSYWYLDRRPDAPKINLAIAGSALPFGKADALVNIDLTVANVGLSTLEFSQEAIDIYVQQVTPLSDEMRKQLYVTDGSPRDEISSNYAWAALRKLTFPYTARIEAGETDHYYFRTVVPCARDLVVLLQARLPKKKHGIAAIPAIEDVSLHIKNERWVVESFLDVGPACTAKKDQEPVTLRYLSTSVVAAPIAAKPLMPTTSRTIDNPDELVKPGPSKPK